MDEATMSDCHETIFLSGSSYSSLSSDSSSASCGKSSPHPSSLGLRRSTLDLMDLDSSGFPSQNSLSSRQKLNSAARPKGTPTVGESSCLPSRLTYDVNRMHHHRGIEAIVHDTFFDNLALIDLTKAFSNLLSKFFDDNRTDVAVNVHHHSNTQRCSSAEESKVEDNNDNLSPCKIHISQLESADEWDHFADFQDRIMDGEVITTFTLCTERKSKGKLDTLDEIEEEEEGLDVFSF